jgi:peptide chain release factor 1
VTVTVTDPVNITSLSVNDNDFMVDWYSGTGAGGQHRNKKKTSCRVTHIPTGLTESRQGRNRESNFIQAKSSLIKRIEQDEFNSINANINSIKREQAGSGMRGDKIRTYRFQDDWVVDHVSGKSLTCKKVMKGFFDRLWL